MSLEPDITNIGQWAGKIEAKLFFLKELRCGLPRRARRSTWVSGAGSGGFGMWEAPRFGEDEFRV